MEGRGLTDQARQYYEGLLREDDSDIVSSGLVTGRPFPWHGSPTTTADSPLAPSQAARKRLIALHLAAPGSTSTALTTKGKGTKTSQPGVLSKETGIDLLVEYLDTFYSDPEGWSQLAAAYAELGL